LSRFFPGHGGTLTLVWYRVDAFFIATEIALGQLKIAMPECLRTIHADLSALGAVRARSGSYRGGGEPPVIRQSLFST
jgi:hypothetical protein